MSELCFCRNNSSALLTQRECLCLHGWCLTWKHSVHHRGLQSITTHPSPAPPFGYCLNFPSMSLTPLSLSLSLCAVFVFSRPACLSNSKYPCYLTQIHLSTWPRTQRRVAVCVSETVYSPVTPLPSGLKDWVNTHTLTHTLPRAAPFSEIKHRFNLWHCVQTGLFAGEESLLGSVCVCACVCV